MTETTRGVPSSADREILNAKYRLQYGETTKTGISREPQKLGKRFLERGVRHLK